MERDPCPKRIWNDSGAGFAMGAIGGSMFHGIKGFRNSPSPAVRHVSQCSSSSSSSSSSSGRARWLVKCVSHWNEWISMAVDQVSRRLCCVEGARTSDRRQLRHLGRTLLGHRLLAGADTQEGGACGRVWVGAHRISASLRRSLAERRRTPGMPSSQEPPPEASLPHAADSRRRLSRPSSVDVCSLVSRASRSCLLEVRAAHTHVHVHVLVRSNLTPMTPARIVVAACLLACYVFDSSSNRDA